MSIMRQQLTLNRTLEVWTRELSLALEARGFASLTAYVDSRPLASLAELADDLGGPDAAPTALEQRLVGRPRRREPWSAVRAAASRATFAARYPRGGGTTKAIAAATNSNSPGFFSR